MTDEILSPARLQARKQHEQLLRDDPKYRKEWEEVTRIWSAVFGDDPPDDETTS